MAAFKKQYGLIVTKKSATLGARLSVFDDDDDDDVGSVGLQLQKEGLKAKVKKSTQLTLDKAVAQDPTVFEYDNVYDEIEMKKKQLQQVKETKERKPKYIEALMKSAESRKKEQERRVERQVQKEREEEGEEFADKEAFVTTAYKKKMQEMQELEEKEKQEEMMEALTDVTKQKDLSGFYRHMMRQKFGEETESLSCPAPDVTKEAATEVVTIKKEKCSDGSASEHEVDQAKAASKEDEAKNSDPVKTSSVEKERTRERRLSSSQSADEGKSKHRSRTSKSKDKHHRRHKDKKSPTPNSDEDKGSKRRHRHHHRHKESRKRQSSEGREDCNSVKKSNRERKASSSPNRNDSKSRKKEKGSSPHMRKARESSTQPKKQRRNSRSSESADEKSSGKGKSNKRAHSASDASDSEEPVVGPVAPPAVKETPEERMQRVFRARNVGEAVSDARERYLMRKKAKEAAKSAFQEAKE